MMSDEKKEIIKAENASTFESPLAIPMMPIEELSQLTAYVNKVKKALMKEGDDYIIDYQGRQYTARSGFSKLAQGFGLSDDPATVKTLYEEEPREYVITFKAGGKWKTKTVSTKIKGFEATVRVYNKYGRQATNQGACTVEELHLQGKMGPKWYHVCLGTAITRAYNRAVSNFVGSAEVSAEEMGFVYEDKGEAETSGPRKEKAEDVKVSDMMKKQEDKIKAPEWDFRDEINRAPGLWTQKNAVATLENWFIDAGWSNPKDIFEVKLDQVKLIVSARGVDKAYRLIIGDLLTSHGFKKARKGWRLNKKDVVDWDDEEEASE